MIHLFHGDDIIKSRQAFNHFITQQNTTNITRLDSAKLDPQVLELFFNSPGLIPGNKVLALSNPFSLSKKNLDLLLKLIRQQPQLQVILWHSQKLTPTQIKLLPQPEINFFPLDRKLFLCLNNLRPQNATRFFDLYHQLLDQEPFEFFLYLLKKNLRRQISSYSPFPKPKVIATYLKSIEIDYFNKSGLLTIPKEIALERVLLNLMLS